MSTAKGDSSRTRPQKHKNKTAFKNTLHDTSHQTKFINNIQVCGVCSRCKDIIEWKIKYKKYKPLTQPRRCIKCDQKTVKYAYHVMCLECGRTLQLCTKCCTSKEIVPAMPNKEENTKLNEELQTLLQSLPERKRRTFVRFMNKTNPDKEGNSKPSIEDLKTKLSELKLGASCDLDEDEDSEGSENYEFHE